MSAETLSTESPMSVRDQFLIIADNVREHMVGEKLLSRKLDQAWTVNVVREDNTPYAPPPAHAKLAVVALYQGPEIQWQGLEAVDFGLIEEGYDWTVRKSHEPEVYEEDYFTYLLGLTRAYLDQPDKICVQAFKPHRISSTVLAGLDVSTKAIKTKETNDKRGPGRIESAFGSGSHLS